jgi:hypothetical protein
VGGGEGLLELRAAERFQQAGASAKRRFLGSARQSTSSTRRRAHGGAFWAPHGRAHPARGGGRAEALFGLRTASMAASGTFIRAAPGLARAIARTSSSTASCRTITSGVSHRGSAGSTNLRAKPSEAREGGRVRVERKSSEGRDCVQPAQ